MTSRSFVLISESVQSRAVEYMRSRPIDPAHPLEVVVREYKSKRSLDQNRLHWKRLDVLRLFIADSTGEIYSAEELHDFFKAKFMPANVVAVGDEWVKVPRTTTKMNTKEFAEFMEQIDRYCVDRLGLYLPQPGMED